MSRPRALDLFCGAGGASMGLHRAGFEVTGIDIKPQPHYPFRFIQGDALKPPLRLEDFDLVWASPPCQGYSRTRHLPWLKDRKHPMLIPNVREMFRGRSTPCVIENVKDSPLRGVRLRGGMFGLPHRRERTFEANFLILAPIATREPVGLAGSMFGSRLARQQVGAGCDWMTRDEATEAIPPAYAEHVGRYAMMALGARGEQDK